MFRLLSFLIFVGLLVTVFTTANFASYAQLKKEVPIATLTFEKGHNGFYKRWKVHYHDIETQGEFDGWIYADQFRLDVRFIKMKPWANLLGVEPRYVIERIEGRYKNIKEQNSQIHFAYDLDEDEPFYLEKSWLDYNVIIDVEYGSSVYTRIQEGVLYTVYYTNSGVLVRCSKKSVIIPTKKWWEIF